MFNVDRLRLQIAALIREYPDLADDELLRGDMLEAETDINDVLASLFVTANEARKMVTVQTEELKDYSARRARFARQVEYLRAIMLLVLQSADLKKVVLPQVTLSQAQGTQEIIGEPDGDLLPDDLVRIRREPNRTAIREALLGGREVPGCALSNAAPKLMMRKR